MMKCMKDNTLNAVKDPSYTEMGMGPASQLRPTLKEYGSYGYDLPVGSSQKPSGVRKPEKVFSYIVDEPVPEELQKRSYSVGSKPVSSQTVTQRRLSVETDKSTSLVGRNHHSGSKCVNISNQWEESAESSDFVEIEFIRPRAVSDSKGCRPRTSGLQKQFSQGHRPRSSSYGGAAVRQLRFEKHQNAKVKDNMFKGYKGGIFENKTKHEQKIQGNICNVLLAQEQKKIDTEKSNYKVCDDMDGKNNDDKGKHLDKRCTKLDIKPSVEDIATHDDGYCHLDFSYTNKKNSTD